MPPPSAASSPSARPIISPPKTAHLISNHSTVDTRFLLVHGVGTCDFLRVGG
jgi:hypothetical protein